VEGSESGVAAASAVAPLSFEVVEELGDERGVKIGELEA